MTYGLNLSEWVGLGSKSLGRVWRGSLRRDFDCRTSFIQSFTHRGTSANNGSPLSVPSTGVDHVRVKRKVSVISPYNKVDRPHVISSRSPSHLPSVLTL